MSAATNPGDIKGGYRFIEGDPRDHKNWQPVHGPDRVQAPQLDLFGHAIAPEKERTRSSANSP